MKEYQKYRKVIKATILGLLALLLSCGEDEGAMDNSITDSTKENTFCFGTLEIPISRASVNIIGPFPGDMPEFYNYDVELFGTTGGTDYVFVLEVYPLESTPDDTDITLGTFRTHLNALTEGGVEARIGNVATNEVFFIEEGEVTITRSGNSEFTISSRSLDFDSGDTGNVQFSGTVEVNDFDN